MTSKLNMNSKQSPAAAASNSTAKFGRLGPNQLSMFQHPDAPNLKIRFKSANFYCQLPININNQSTVNKKYLADLTFLYFSETEKTSLRSPRPTRPTPGKMDSLFPPRDVSKSRSLSPAPSRPRPPTLPTGHLGPGCVETGHTDQFLIISCFICNMILWK